MKTVLQDILELSKKGTVRREKSLFIVEGEKMVGEIPPEKLEQIVISDSYQKSHPALVFSVPCEVLKVKDSEFNRISDTETPQGILAVVRMTDYTEKDFLEDKDGMYVFLENVQDPGNVGTIFRSSEAAGVKGIVLDEDSADPYNPKVVRSTMGAIFRIPFIRIPKTADFIRSFQISGGKVYAAALNGASEYTKKSYQGKIAFLMGNESKGLTQEAIEKSDTSVFIPMEGKVESLNVAMATTILLYEGHRVRKGTKENET